MTPGDARLAAVLLAIDPTGLGGAWLRRGATGRSAAWLDLLRAALPHEAPLRRLPAHADDTALWGGLDLSASLTTGRPVLQAGLLTRCDGGVLVVPMAERLSPARAAVLAGALDSGNVRLERDGMALDQPARLAVVALDESRPDEADTLPAALAERLSLVLDAIEPDTAGPADVQQLAAPLADPQPLAARVADARSRLPGVTSEPTQLQALAGAAERLGLQTVRPLWQAWRAAHAAAAWAGRSTLATEDLQLALRLVLLPRATQIPAPEPDDEPFADDTVEPDPPPPPPAQPAPPDPPAEDASSPADAPPPPPDATDDEAPTDPAAIDAASERLIAAALSALPPGLLGQIAIAATRRAAGGPGRSGERQRAMRGRPRGSRAGAPRGGSRVHLIDTLRAAAPWQPLRRREAAARCNGTRPAVLVRPEDIRLWRFQQSRQTTTVFVVDASGSAALHRLGEAKGAVEALLAECYVRRDRVALVSFRGNAAGGAELLLPPTRSLARARRCLSALPGGGGTPLAGGLALAHEVVQAEWRRGATPVTVVLSDGRANLARDGTPGRPAAMADALACARAWAADGLAAIWLDTSARPDEAAARLAAAMAARYLHLPVIDHGRVVSAITGSR